MLSESMNRTMFAMYKNCTHSNIDGVFIFYLSTIIILLKDKYTQFVYSLVFIGVPVYCSEYF